MSSDEKFYKEIDLMFEGYLLAKENNLKIRVKDMLKKKMLNDSDMNYSKVLFDTDMNIYKIEKDGSIAKVENINFEAVIAKKE